MIRPFGSRVPISVVSWVLFCAYCNCLGWLLSAVHQLNATAYLITLLPWLAAGGLLARRAFGRAGLVSYGYGRQGRRFSRFLPLAFLVLAVLAIVGGFVHAPNNYDALSYRVPRVFHWLAEGRWHWIHTDYQRLNTRGCGIEWLSAPIIALFRTDRLLFVPNAICYLLLPGRVFGLLTRLGVRPRVAWHWMWIFPTGYGYLLQAGSIGNDFIGGFFAFTAIEFALRARDTGRQIELWVSIFAAGIMTAIKTFNILLLLPWVLAIWPALLVLLRRPFVSLAGAGVAACASLLPTMLLNWKYCGDWTGQAAEKVTTMATGAPLFHIVVNILLTLLTNFTPPIFPLASAWNNLMTRVIPAATAQKLAYYFEPFGAGFQTGEMQTEEFTGLGLGVSLLLVWVLVRILRRCSFRFSFRSLLQCKYLVPLGAVVGALVFMAESGLRCPSRYMIPFYVVFAAPLLAQSAAATDVIRSRWWRPATVLVFVSAGLLLAMAPARPLWPALTVLNALGGKDSSNRLVLRAWTVYSIYAVRADAFAPFKKRLPAEANPLGFVTSDDPETSLWLPVGSRRILHIAKGDTPESIRQRGIEYILAKPNILSNICDGAVQEWIAGNNADQVWQMRLELRASTEEPMDWLLLRRRK